jgi:hypothetical protein
MGNTHNRRCSRLAKFLEKYDHESEEADPRIHR